jgi:hypothetical protein
LQNSGKNDIAQAKLFRNSPFRSVIFTAIDIPKSVSANRLFRYATAHCPTISNRGEVVTNALVNHSESIASALNDNLGHNYKPCDRKIYTVVTLRHKRARGVATPSYEQKGTIRASPTVI